MSAWAVIKCYEWRWGVVVRANRVPTNKVDGDLRCMCENNLFRVSSWFCVLAKC